MSNLKLSVSLLEEDKVLQEGAAGTLTWGAGEGRKVSPRKAEQIEIWKLRTRELRKAGERQVRSRRSAYAEALSWKEAVCLETERQGAQAHMVRASYQQWSGRQVGPCCPKSLAATEGFEVGGGT